MRRILFFVLVGLMAQPASAATIDGALAGGDNYGSALAVQDTPTGFGDNTNELNAAFGELTGSGDINLLLTGNLNTSGEGFLIFLDTRAGGAVASTIAGGYGVLGSIGGARIDDWGTDTDGGAGVSATPGGGSILDPGFNPDIALEVNAGGGGPGYFINVIDLTLSNDGDPDVDNFLGAGVLNGASATQSYTRSDGDVGKGSGGSITHAFDNTNILGVSGTDASGALTATTGLELLLSADFLAADVGFAIKAMVVLTNDNGGFLSNQFLGEAGLAGAPNLGGPGGDGGVPLFDAQLFAGNQFFTIVPEPATFTLAGLALAAMAFSRRRSS